ncbi:hypothetical protein [Streptomyces sp. NBC_00704]|uniref:hypothetical protein n=1 Tax=Streptomyces sp. NBC_00704 TaxID=2975809 RepID=UPI003FA7DA62
MLQGAVLRGAVLRGAVVSGAVLAGAVGRGAVARPFHFGTQDAQGLPHTLVARRFARVTFWRTQRRGRRLTRVPGVSLASRSGAARAPSVRPDCRSPRCHTGGLLSRPWNALTSGT